MTGLTIGSLFSGYGGLDMAVEQVTGARPAWFVEYDTAPSKILAHHWPDVPNYGDVTAVDWATMPPVDILTGGYPCQPFSAAGQRKGTTDDRHLWPYVREAIRVLRPRLTILENVAGHRSLGFDRVLGDMAEDGLHVRWTSVRASDIGAPHHRERLFIIASPDGLFDAGHDAGRAEQRIEHADTPPRVGESSQGATDPGHEPGRGWATDDSGETSAGPHGIRVQCGDGDGGWSGEPGQDATDAAGERWGEGAEQPRAGTPEITAPVGGEPPAPDPGGPAVGEHAGEPPAEETGPGGSHGPGDHRGERPAQIGREGATAPGSEECARRPGLRAEGEEEVGRRRPGDSHNENVDWGPYAAAVRRWERLTRPAPAPTEPNTKGNPRLNAAFAEWMMGLPEGHVTQVPGISRADQLKAIGNGVCPQQAAAAIHQLLTSPAPAGHFS